MIYLNIFEACNGRTPWELLLWLLGAFILGYLFRHFLTVGQTLPQAIHPGHGPGSTHATTHPLLRPTEPPPNAPTPLVPAQTEKKTRDDLTKIEGIGPKINSLLNQAGIDTFQDLASSNYDTLKRILDQAGERFKVHNPTTWPRQARLAAEGNWKELATLQDALKGGRE